MEWKRLEEKCTKEVKLSMLCTTLVLNHCNKKAWVVKSKQLVASSRQCSSTLFGQNSEIFSLPPNDYPRAPLLFIWFGSEWFFPVYEDRRSAEGLILQVKKSWRRFVRECWNMFQKKRSRSVSIHGKFKWRNV